MTAISQVISGLPRWLRGKEPACTGKRYGFSPWVREDPLEEEMATRFNIPTWKIPDSGDQRAMVSRIAESNTTEKMSTCACTNTGLRVRRAMPQP